MLRGLSLGTAIPNTVEWLLILLRYCLISFKEPKTLFLVMS
jgi:hypothetical protein